MNYAPSKIALQSAQRVQEIETPAAALGKLGKTHYILGEGQMVLDFYEQNSIPSAY